MSQPSKSNRIWELDALRGICILFVVFFHFLYDLQALAGFRISDYPAVFWIMQYGGILFVLLSGLCATLGRRSFRRGLLVFACGMVITLVTFAMAKLGMAHESIIIRFGVLHLLGVCMMVWPLFKKLPVWLLVVIGIALLCLGQYFDTIRVESHWLFPLGLRYVGFATSDYFPICPNLGWFLLGAVLGRTAYRNKRSLLPRFPSEAAPIRFFRWCGTHSLWIYLLHQPIIYGIMEVVLLVS